MTAEDRQLHVFVNEVTDWIIAADKADAIKVWEEINGESWKEYAGENDDDWIEEPDDGKLTVYQEDLTEPIPLPAGAIIVESGDGWQKVQATFRAWADAYGRGFLASTEY